MAVLRHDIFLGKDVLAFTSDALMDFYKGDPSNRNDFILTNAQRDWLSCNKVPAPHKLIFPKQVHGALVWKVTEKDVIRRGRFEADAVMTNVSGLPIAVRTADCLPLLFYDPKCRVIAAVHAGWKSSQLKIVLKTIEMMKADYGVDPVHLRVSLGPCIRWESYEVGAEFKEYFPQDVTLLSGQLHFDIVAANVRQLLDAGVRQENIFDCRQDTFSAPGYHSYRRDGDKAGRMINLIMMK